MVSLVSFSRDTYNREVAKGNLSTAESIACRAARYWEQNGDMREAGIWRRLLATAIHDQGRYRDAAVEARRSAEIQPDPYERALSLQGLTNYEIMLRNESAARAALEEGESIASAFRGDAYLWGNLKGTRAWLTCTTDGDPGGAFIEWAEGAALLSSAAQLWRAACQLNSLGFELARSGRPLKGEPLLLQSLRFTERDPQVHLEGAILDSLGYAYTLLGRRDDAERALRSSARIFESVSDPAQLIGTLLHLSELHQRMRNWRVARDEANRALKLAKDINLPHLALDAMNQLQSIERPPAARTPIDHESFHGLLYAANAMRTLVAQLMRVAPTDEVVLLEGETGTGKELLARALHHESKRRSGPFVPFNCSALSRELVESRLFGHYRGAFTGADRDQQGVIRAAEGGTLFLDEIGDLSAEAQGALLRFLQSGEIQPVGAGRPLKVNVRVVVATNRDLKRETEAGRFRKDLFYRLYVATLWVPPLRSRSGDVGLLARHFAHLYSKEYDLPQPWLGRSELSRLEDYDWPGNVRELEAVIKRLILMGPEALELDTNSGIARPDVLRLAVAEKTGPVTAQPPKGKGWLKLTETEKRRLLMETLTKNRGNINATGAELGISRRTVYNVRRRMGLEALVDQASDLEDSQE